MVIFTSKTFNQRKRIKRKVQKGVVHIKATYNNTLITIRTIQGCVLSWCSSGSCGFHGARKGTPFAAKVAAEKVSKKDPRRL